MLPPLFARLPLDVADFQLRYAAAADTSLLLIFDAVTLSPPLMLTIYLPLRLKVIQITPFFYA